MIRNIILLLLLLFNVTQMLAQQPLNFDFEKKSAEAGRPWGWSTTGWGPGSFGLDSLQVREGKYSLRAACALEAADCEEESYRFSIEPLELSGNTLRFKGYIKGEGLSKTVYLSVLYSYIAQGVMQEKEVRSQSFSGTFEWLPMQLQLQLPDSIQSFHFDIHYSGQGQVWCDGFQLSINEVVRDEVQVAKAFSNQQMEWLAEQVVSFSSPLPYSTAIPFDKEELSCFGKAVGNSRIIALGESTHGTSEFFTLKHKLLQYAVEELGFRVFAIEDHQLIVRQVDHYIKTGEGTPAKSMTGMFGVWGVKEVRDLIAWMRAYNEKHPDDMLSFIGFDIQNVEVPSEQLSQFLQMQDTSLYQKLAPRLRVLREKGANWFMVNDTLEKQQWVASADTLYEHIKTKRPQWLAQAKNEQERHVIEYGVQAAKVISQFFREIVHNGQRLYRDQAMADNVSWYIEKIDPEAKVVIWAHDVHISRGDHPQMIHNMHSGISMGSFLSKKYGAQFKSFGIASHTGTYRAFTSYAYQAIIDSPLFSSPKGSLDEALHQLALKNQSPNLYLPLPRTEDWLNQPLPVRFANHVSFDYGYWTRYVLPYQFDGLFFIDKTSGAQALGQ